MHAMAGTRNACLCHTMGPGYVHKVNHIEVGEMELCAYLMGELGIPWVFTSGDAHACREAERFVPGMVTAVVKEGTGLKSAVHRTPRDARQLVAGGDPARPRAARFFTPAIALLGDSVGGLRRIGNRAMGEAGTCQQGQGIARPATPRRRPGARRPQSGYSGIANDRAQTCIRTS